LREGILARTLRLGNKYEFAGFSDPWDSQNTVLVDGFIVVTRDFA
jgi:hypothetical protein